MRPCILLLLLALLACAPAPAELDDGWTTASLAEAGLDEQRVAALIERLRSGALTNVHALLVVRGGKLVVEEYLAGQGPRDRQYVASVTKSVTSAVLGAAMAQGALDGVKAGVLDRPLGELLPAYASVLAQDEAKRGLLLHHVLSMTAGLEWDEHSHPYDDPRNDWQAAQRAPDCASFILSRPVVTEPGDVFYYNGGLSQLVSCLIQTRTDMTAERFAQRYLFAPLGIEDYVWESVDDGTSDAAGGLHMRPRDMAKLGQLFLQGGLWEGERIMPRAWVEESTRRHVGNDGSPDYGLQWWNGELLVGGTEVPTYFASGTGGQKIHVFPTLDAVVVLSHRVFDTPLGELNNLAMLTSYLLPAMMPPAAEPPGEAGPASDLSALTGNYLRAGVDESAQVTVAAPGLLLTAPDGQQLELTPLGGDRFTAVVLDLLEVPVRFEDQDGVMTLIVRFGFSERRYRRQPPR